MYEIEKTLEDILGTSTVANMLRLKNYFLSLTRTKLEHRVITLLCDGYTKADLTDELNMHRQQVDFVLKEYRKRIVRFLTPTQKEDIYSVLKGASRCHTL